RLRRGQCPRRMRRRRPVTSQSEPRERRAMDDQRRDETGPTAIGTGRGRRPKGATAGAPLSRREREVLRLMADGKTDREIAIALAISYRTVTTYTGQIFAKFGVRSRVAAVAQAFRRGLA